MEEKNLTRFNYYNLIPIAALVLDLAGIILIACHVLVPGLVVAVLGLACGIATKVLEKKKELNERLAYWSFVLSFVCLFIAAVGFAGYTVLDMILERELG